MKKKRTWKILSLVLAAAMLLSLLAGCKDDNAESSAPAESAAPPAVSDAGAVPSQQVSTGELEELGSGDVKWSEEKTAEGWIKVTNQGGPTLGYSPDSGVKLLQSDGYAFKDMNRNGKLDPYEDWRLDAETRAVDLASQIAWDQIPGLLLLTTKGGRSTNFSDDMKESVNAGVRTFDGSVSEVNDSVSYTNAVQAYAEALDLAIPVDFHAEIGSMVVKLGTSWPEALGLGATFDPELAKNAAEAMSAVYRAAGITTVNAPQIDLITEPRWSRSSGSYTEDPQLGSDMARAFVSGMQSTYGEDGSDLGWGTASVTATLKHFPGNGTAEAGREGHGDHGKYNVYPGDNFYTHLLPFQAAMDLDSATGSAAGVMPDYGIGIDDSGDALGGEKVSSSYSSYKITEVLRGELGFDGMVVTDYDIVDMRPWGTESLSATERVLMIFEAGVDKIGSHARVEDLQDAVQMYVDKYGQEEAETRFRDSARRVVRKLIQIGHLENPYISADAINTALKNERYEDNAYEAHLKSLVMVKNSGNLIGDNGGEKPTVYIPMVYNAGGMGGGFSLTMSGPQAASWAMPINANTASKYFNVVTDRVADTLTGEPDEDGKPTASRDDIIRASAEEIAACDFTLVVINSPSNSGGGYDNETGEYLPISLQYGNYVANSPYVRTQSLGGDTITVEQQDVYGPQTIKSSENRSYYGNAARISNADELDKITYANSVSDNVVVLVKAKGAMVVSEFESSVDAILFDFGGASDAAVCEVISGGYEPSGLLPLQMPANMETVEAQYEDVPRDMECHVDSDGNTYDFAFGLNWSGVIQDARTEKYDVPPLEG